MTPVKNNSHMLVPKQRKRFFQTTNCCILAVFRHKEIGLAALQGLQGDLAGAVTVLKFGV